MDFSRELSRHVACIEHGLDRLVPPGNTRPARLHRAMRYSLEAGGKRLRPVLVLATAESFAAAAAPVGAAPSPPRLGPSLALQPSAIDPLPAAVALECVHTYSLIHDDLPCMDNDDLRRGRPTAHKQFDEATALLAGDALLTHAFALLATGYAAQPALANALTRELADAAGSRRLIGGQMEDLLAERKPDATNDELEFIHLNKTAAMIETALVMGGLVGAHSTSSGQGTSEAGLATLRRAGRHLGLAFQIIDDILDATADTATLGKTAGKDAKAGKTTFVKLHGLEASRRFATEHTKAAAGAFMELSVNTDFLTALVESMATRAS
ncbi:MAG: polyprenyl synthetase family protein [Verrucomicrobia bacterium]|nr:polyprenyl synthetase family protein [Verrucomicrobiota bacterium]